VAAYAKKNSLPYPTLLDPEGTISKSYGVVGVPVKVLIDREAASSAGIAALWTKCWKNISKKQVNSFLTYFCSVRIGT